MVRVAVEPPAPQVTSVKRGCMVDFMRSMRLYKLYHQEMECEWAYITFKVELCSFVRTCTASSDLGGKNSMETYGLPSGDSFWIKSMILGSGGTEEVVVVAVADMLLLLLRCSKVNVEWRSIEIYMIDPQEPSTTTSRCCCGFVNQCMRCFFVRDINARCKEARPPVENEFLRSYPFM
jgi:hypothetical protein